MPRVDCRGVLEFRVEAEVLSVDRLALQKHRICEGIIQSGGGDGDDP